MTPLLLLLGLSLTDALFAGYRAAAGRNPRLHKSDYYLAAAWLGLLGGAVNAVAMALLTCLCMFALVHTGHSWGALWEALRGAAFELTFVYGVFATGLLSMMLLWTYPKRQSRELSVVLVLGPCTLLRPPWVLGGALWVAWGKPLWLAALCVLVALSQLGVEWGLNALQARAQRRRMAAW